MHYEIYPDSLFVENLICNLFVLESIRRTFHCTATWKRRLLAGTAASLCNTIGSILFFRSLWVLKLGVLLPAAGIMVCYGLDIREKRRILFLLYQMIFLTMTAGGILMWLNEFTELRMRSVILVTGLSVIGLELLEKIFIHYREQEKDMRDAVIYFNGTSRKVRGFADSGNTLRDPVSRQPVCIITMEALEELLTTAQKFEIWQQLDFGCGYIGEPTGVYCYIPYQSIGNPEGLLLAMRLDYMAIQGKYDCRVIERPMVGIIREPFAGLFHYSILLHKDYC